jgi:catechol 2,3-dioxygenase-like lactoylglutathione lyase family enzyme
MTVIGFDHVSIPTADAERFLAFYKQLGFQFANEERWRRGDYPVFSLLIGENNIINVHPPGFVTDLRGRAAVPGCGDFCFVWDGTMEDVLTMLEEAGVDFVAGPFPRVGGRERATVPSTSVYTKDPDGNLLEFMVYAE